MSLSIGSLTKAKRITLDETEMCLSCNLRQRIVSIDYEPSNGHFFGGRKYFLSKVCEMEFLRMVEMVCEATFSILQYESIRKKSITYFLAYYLQYSNLNQSEYHA